jgi:BirA family biotin operon repressor/biotin-[acetyl-CoA-carboxylase] ligase
MNEETPAPALGRDQEMEKLLAPGSLGRPFIFVPRIDSTNRELKRMARQGAPHGACLAADYQSAGRGRLNRSWDSLAGENLLFSLLLRPRAELAQAFHFTALAGLSLCLALEEEGLRPLIKWPNDIYLNDAKLGGMLSELESSPSGLEFLVLGIGLNVNQENFSGLAKKAISLKTAANRSWNRACLLARFLAHFTRQYQQWEQDKQQWHQPYLARSWLLGRQVTVADGERQYSGWAETVADDGSLLLLSGQGQRMTVSHGDVSVLASEKI